MIDEYRKVSKRERLKTYKRFIAELLITAKPNTLPFNVVKKAMSTSVKDGYIMWLENQIKKWNENHCHCGCEEVKSLRLSYSFCTGCNHKWNDDMGSHRLKKKNGWGIGKRICELAKKEAKRLMGENCDENCYDEYYHNEFEVLKERVE